MKQKVVITGGSGLIGKKLTDLLSAEGYEVCWLVRKKKEGVKVRQFLWDPANNTVDLEALTENPVIIHLAGEGIADKKWSQARKKELIDSRVKGPEVLLHEIINHQFPVKAFLSASAIGYYGGITTGKIMEENDLPGKDFLATCCVAWESGAEQFRKNGIRTAVVRIGVVFDSEGGALVKMTNPIKWGVGAVLGTGNQWIPWIHSLDVCRVFVWLVKNEIKQGIYNAVSPMPLTNSEFTHLAARKLGRKIWLPPVPAFLLKIGLGEMSVIVTEGCRASADKIVTEGFEFSFPDPAGALSDLLAP